jgi:hypothetical protein
MWGERYQTVKFVYGLVVYGHANCHADSLLYGGGQEYAVRKTAGSTMVGIWNSMYQHTKN